MFMSFDRLLDRCDIMRKLYISRFDFNIMVCSQFIYDINMNLEMYNEMILYCFYINYIILNVLKMWLRLFLLC